MKKFLVGLCLSCIALTASAQSDVLSDETARLSENLREYVESLPEGELRTHIYIPFDRRSFDIPRFHRPPRGEMLIRRVPPNAGFLSLGPAPQYVATRLLFSSNAGKTCLTEAVGEPVSSENAFIQSVILMGEESYEWDIILNYGADSETYLFVRSSIDPQTRKVKYECEVWED